MVVSASAVLVVVAAAVAVAVVGGTILDSPTLCSFGGAPPSPLMELEDDADVENDEYWIICVCTAWLAIIAALDEEEDDID